MGLASEKSRALVRRQARLETKGPSNLDSNDRRSGVRVVELPLVGRRMASDSGCCGAKLRWAKRLRSGLAPFRWIGKVRKHDYLPAAPTDADLCETAACTGVNRRFASAHSSSRSTCLVRNSQPPKEISNEADDVRLDRLVRTARSKLGDAAGADTVLAREVSPQNLDRPLGVLVVEERPQKLEDVFEARAVVSPYLHGDRAAENSAEPAGKAGVISLVAHTVTSSNPVWDSNRIYAWLHEVAALRQAA